MKRFVVLFVTLFAVVFMTAAGVTTTVVAAQKGLLSKIGIVRGELQPMDIAKVVDISENSVDQFAREHELPTATWIDLPSGSNVFIPFECGLLASSRTMFGFCSANQTIYIGLDLATKLNTKYFLATGIAAAHEYGHYLQSLTGTNMDNFVQPLEDGADCVAGVWLSWLNKTTQIHLSLEDLPGIVRLISSIARQQPDDPHGTFGDRARALALGFFGESLAVCNKYTPTVK